MIHLEKFTTADFDRFISWIENEAELIQFAGSLFKYPLDHQQLGSYLLQVKKHPLKIMLTASDDAIGHCELNFENDIPRLSRILIGEKKFRNKGLGTLVVKEMIKMIFDATNVQCVDLNVFEWNANAIACYKKIGFKADLSKTSQMTLSGTTWNAYTMVLNKADWIK